MMGGKVMGMPVVPQEAMVEEAKAAGFAMAQPDPFGWPYFTGPHYVNGPDGRGYGVLLMKPEDVSPVKKPFCNCACGGSGQCGVACSSCDCEGCAPAPSPPPPPKQLCNCKQPPRSHLLYPTFAPPDSPVPACLATCSRFPPLPSFVGAPPPSQAAAAARASAAPRARRVTARAACPSSRCATRDAAAPASAASHARHATACRAVSGGRESLDRRR
jgi:hypothetical protein